MKKYKNTINRILSVSMILVSRLWCTSELPGSIPEHITTGYSVYRELPVTLEVEQELHQQIVLQVHILEMLLQQQRYLQRVGQTNPQIGLEPEQVIAMAEILLGVYLLEQARLERSISRLQLPSEPEGRSSESESRSGGTVVIPGSRTMTPLSRLRRLIARIIGR
jgi:hypothetical protein